MEPLTIAKLENKLIYLKNHVIFNHLIIILKRVEPMVQYVRRYLEKFRVIKHLIAKNKMVINFFIRSVLT